MQALTGAPANALAEGAIEGGIRFEGPLAQPEQLSATVEISQLEIASRAQRETPAKAGRLADLALKNSGPIVIEAAGGMARVRRFNLEGNETNVAIAGSVPYLEKIPATPPI